MVWSVFPFFIGVITAALKFAITRDADVGMLAFCISGVLSGFLGAGLVWGELAVFFKRKDLSPNKFITYEMIIWGITMIFCVGMIIALGSLSHGSDLARSTYNSWHGLMIIPVLGIMNGIAGAVLTIISSVKKK